LHRAKARFLGVDYASEGFVTLALIPEEAAPNSWMMPPPCNGMQPPPIPK
jgi:hypothetical protein